MRSSTSSRACVIKSMLKQLLQIFSSLRLTVTCLVLGCVIVFWGTLAQVQIGLYRAPVSYTHLTLPTIYSV